MYIYIFFQPGYAYWVAYVINSLCKSLSLLEHLASLGPSIYFRQIYPRKCVRYASKSIRMLISILMSMMRFLYFKEHNEYANNSLYSLSLTSGNVKRVKVFSTGQDLCLPLNQPTSLHHTHTYNLMNILTSNIKSHFLCKCNYSGLL